MCKQVGDVWEVVVCCWLESKGLWFIVVNVCECGGEIDLIMCDGKMMVFVEVCYWCFGFYGGVVVSVICSK